MPFQSDIVIQTWEGDGVIPPEIKAEIEKVQAKLAAQKAAAQRRRNRIEDRLEARKKFWIGVDRTRSERMKQIPTIGCERFDMRTVDRIKDGRKVGIRAYFTFYSTGDPRSMTTLL
jgi:hypothetical protein